MRYLITYDVATPDRAGKKRLTRVAKTMERYGVRVQKSVFECLLSDTKLEQLLFELEDIMKLSMDSLLVYKLGRNARVLRLGSDDEDPLTPASFVL